jgi:hypothetical protein
MRADKFRNTAAVLKEVIKNPALTEKEVSKRT